MKRSDWEDRCKRHPDYRLSKGVCPNCLREKLTHLSASSSATNTTHASSGSTDNSLYSSNSNLSPGQAAASPPPPITTSKEIQNPNLNSEALQKSRSLAFEIKEEREAEIIEKKKDRKKKKKKIERFFSRIIHGRDRRKKEKEDGTGHEHGHEHGHDLFPSKTMKEKSSTKWVF